MFSFMGNDVSSYSPQVQLVDDLRSAVERERAALEWLEGMISSERKLLNSCGSRTSGSPVSTLQVHGDELESEMSYPHHMPEEERRRRAAEKRAAFLTSVSGVQIPQNAPDPALLPPSVHASSVLSTFGDAHATADVAPSVCYDLFTVRVAAPGPSTSAPVNVENVSEQERKRRAEERRAAFLGTNVAVGIAEDTGLGGQGNDVEVAQGKRENARVPTLSVQSPSIKMHSPSRSHGPSIAHVSLRTPSQHSPFIGGRHEVGSQNVVLSLPLLCFVCYLERCI